ncbi:MAG: Hsp20/alpha crystallin family protein [Chloroflexi bacterium]|nr:Hsp20/alpha crystallin family protein [Chloroflexota bacterium]
MIHPGRNGVKGSVDVRREIDAKGSFDDVFKQMERFIDHVSTSKRTLTVFTQPMWQPLVDVYENPEAVVVLVELAGINRQELELSVDGQVLVLRGNRKDVLRGRKQRCYVLEISFGPFERVIPLPARVNAEKADANYVDGFLEVVLPKVNEEQPRRVIIT